MSASFVLYRGLARHAGDEEVDGPDADEAGKAEHGDVRMAYDPVRQVRHALDDREGLERPLKADDQVPDEAGKDPLSPYVRVEGSEPSLHGEPQIDQHGQYGKEHADGPRHRHHLEPGGDGRLEQVVRADVGVEDEDGPEADQRERVAEEGRPGDDGNDVIGGGDGQGREEEAHYAVTVEPGEYAVRYAGDGARYRGARRRFRRSRSTR